MAFDTKSFVEKYSTTKSTSGFDVEAFTKKYSNPIVNSGFDLNKFTSKYVKPKNNLKTSEGLYNLATQNGLKSQADRILATQTGEETKKIFSGGFISDIFDVLSALQYGVVGMAKGKSFSEGVKTRQSFTDQDALGDEGIPGVIGGIALDIAADPLTYIPIAGQISAVNKIIKATKIAKGLKFAKEVTFGKNVVKAIEGTDKTYQTLEGGTKLGKFLASKVKYMFGADPIFRETFERSVKNIAVGTQNIVKFGKSVAKLEPETAAKILVKTADGRFSRKPLEILTKELAPNELEPVINLYKTIDDLGKEAVDLGLLSKAKYEENIGEYLKNAYTEYELAKGKGLFPSKAVGIKGIKKRVDDLSPEQMKELGQIDNPAYLLFKSAFDLTRDIENAKLFKNVAEKFGTDVAQEGFTQMPKTAKYVTSAGKQAEILSGVKKINTDLKPLFTGLKQTFKADKKVLSEIGQLESKFSDLTKLQGDELYKFFNEGEKIIKTTSTARKLGTIPEALQPLANIVKNFNDFETFIKSKDSIQLEKAFEDGVLERNGFSSMKKFFDTVKNPFKEATTGTKEVIAKGESSKLVKLQKQIESVLSKSKTLKEIDKRSIDDSFRLLEKNINDLRFSKEELLEGLADAKLGDLAGKYVPDNVALYLNEIIEPAKNPFIKNTVANFKFFKVVMNPATHARNIISNKILNYWKLGMNPLDPRTISSEAQAVKEIAKGSGKWIDEARPLGYDLNSFASQEMKTMLDSPEAMLWGKTQKGWATMKQKLGDIYQGEENWAKLSAYIYNRTAKKLNPEDAWKAAESATFNYAQVTPFVRKLRESLFGFPFITFTAKVTPLALETAVKNPGRISIIQKIKQGIESQAGIEQTDKERANEPSWVKNGFYIKLPGEDKQGRSKYFDLTYIIPFGDLLSGGFFGGGTDMEKGTPKNPIINIAEKSPMIQVISSLAKNKDFYGNEIYRNSDTPEKQASDIMFFLAKNYIPPTIADQIPSGYKDGVKQTRGIKGALEASRENQKRNLSQELIRNLGIKIQPIDADIQETYTEWNRKKALETLLRDNGIMDKFDINFIPK